ncbi:ethylmalonyl-CoA decarboxylase-like [Mercenaria mercenaria]|uniref:ethylmalonyl-CoA decarboxylase-like n=1 Tax=Mercenaria mercenaria TaxID=6596 RepID=UPI00234EA37A|nr:ethylmalonyl-CoA decarboxylase-like [Mercenaria mercenaria]
MLIQSIVKVLLPAAGQSIHSRCICHRSLSSLSELRNQFQKLPGGSVDLAKDETSGIATVIINNPGRKNAFTGKMMVDFYDCVSDLEKWVTGKCVILAGCDGTFCSGGDLQTVQANLSNGEEMSELMQNATARLFNLPLVSVAAIDGHALGGGAELATACDFRIMKPTAKVGFVQVKLNIATGWGGCTRLVELLGRTKALRLLSSGMIMNAETAYRIGFADDILDENGDIVELGKQWLIENCIGNAAATRVIKQMVLAGVQFDEAASLKCERQLFCQVWGKETHREALSMNKKHK